MTTQTERDLVKQLSRRLAIDYWQERHDARGPVMIAGPRGTIRPAGGGLIIVLRPAAAAPVEGYRLQLLNAGLLAMGRGAMMLTRFPADEAEARSLRELLGLYRKRPLP